MRLFLTFLVAFAGAFLSEALRALYRGWRRGRDRRDPS